MAAKTGTYTLIASNTLSSNAGSITFSSIPGTYTDLILVSNIIGNATQENYFRLNSDTGSNYSSTLLAGNGTSATSVRFSNQDVAYISRLATSVVTNPNYNSILSFMDYANTTTYKTAIARANNAGAATEAVVSLWRSTSAVNSITILPSTSSYASGSTFKLYGIEAGNL
jgi:hypothetical protein